jgi:hypothetical protein
LGREWEIENVVLERNQTGLGFSISGVFWDVLYNVYLLGGIDKPPDPDHYIRVVSFCRHFQ